MIFVKCVNIETKCLKMIHLRIIFKIRKQDWLKVFHYINLIAIVACRNLDVHIIHSNQNGYASVCFDVATVWSSKLSTYCGYHLFVRTSSRYTHMQYVCTRNMHTTVFFFHFQMGWDCGLKKMKSQNFSLHILMHIYTWGWKWNYAEWAKSKNGTNES